MKKTFTTFFILHILATLSLCQIITKTSENNKGNLSLNGAITCSDAFYSANSTQSLNFTLEYSTSDAEWVDGFSITFPTGITPQVNGTTSSIAGTSLIISGQTATWGDVSPPPSGYGSITPGSYNFTISVSIDASVNGIQTISYFIMGDFYNNAPPPNILSGDLIISDYTSFNSNLPIVIIETDGGVSIPNEPKVLGNMKIIYHTDGSRNYMADQNNLAFLNYNGRIGIETRGSTSQDFSEKKPYGFTTYLSGDTNNNNVSLLGMPVENDWILNALAFDNTLIRDYLSFDIARSMGNYASGCHYCELIVNGSYRGLYILMEKIKVDNSRVNIVKMTTNDTIPPDITGGYITKADKINMGETLAWTETAYNGSTVNYFITYPKEENIISVQSNYIRNYFTSFQSCLNSNNSSIIDGYPSYIDIPSFVDFMLLTEISSNVDEYQLSTYFHKDKCGKLRAGPIWDFNLSFGNDLFFLGFDRSKTNIWQFDNSDNVGSRFWKDLFNETEFKCYLAQRWDELSETGQTLNYTVLSNKIDALVTLLSEARVRDNSTWNSTGNNSQYNMNISTLKSWILTRITWINANIQPSWGCNFPSVLPPLVISKIHYNPLPESGYTSDDLEYIEITNNSTSVVDLTGIYFKELGISYQFPANSTIGAGSTLYLAGRSSSFNTFYGFAPFGEFSRNLSNKSERLILADAFGNTIDSVEYRDSIPWPTSPDGGGYYLQLINPNLDNSLASSWIADNGQSSSTSVFFSPNDIRVFPNPVNNIVNTESHSGEIIFFEILDLIGQTVFQSNIGIPTEYISINIEHLPPGAYSVRITLENKTQAVKKIVKL
ncbi:MAG: secretion system protein Por [Bacteroidetes bacterium HGW-Bacteroidetes-6]|jgi:hypothetical protein|nr:MAG: secretion system protein Por [Bacteroidetes bacterium HGW-Bacteroidetes-6]